LGRLEGRIADGLSVAERFQLLSDHWALCLGGKIGISDYLRLTGCYKEESDPAVASLLCSQLSYLDRFVDDHSRRSFALFVQDRLTGIHQRLGWQASPGEPPLSKLLRGTVIETLGTIGQNKSIIERARQMFAKLAENPQAVDPDLRQAITDIVAYNSDERQFAAIQSLWRSASTPEDKERYLMALAVFRKPRLINRCLQLALSASVRTQDAPHLIAGVLSNNAGTQIGFSFICRHWSRLARRFPRNLMTRMIAHLSSLDTEDQLSGLRALFNTHPLPAGSRTQEQTLERVSIAVAFRQGSAEKLNSWIREHYPASKSASSLH